MLAETMKWKLLSILRCIFDVINENFVLVLVQRIISKFEFILRRCVISLYNLVYRN